MRANVIGRVRNTQLPKSHGLLPLFEAIINSIDAIEEANLQGGEGFIKIYLLRPPSFLDSQTVEPEQRVKGPITDIKVVDNGIGFTESNYQAFNEADTMSKSSKGGKGVGRFIWLKAFDRVLVDSIFREDNDEVYHRHFEFSTETESGIKNEQVSAASLLDERITTVHLQGFKDTYEKNCPKQTAKIAQRIVEHCLGYFLLGTMPQIVLHDEAESPINLWEIYGKLVSTETIVKIKVQNREFTLIHFMLHAIGDVKHQFCYCADNRAVKPEPIGAKIPNLPSPIIDGEDEYIYAGYVLSDYLNERVNQERTDFDLYFESTSLLPGEINFLDVEAQVLENAKEFLEEYTEKVKAQKIERISQYVEQSAPEFRHILKHHPEKLDPIPLDLSDTKLNTQLYEISRQLEAELREEGPELLEQVVQPSSITDQYEYMEHFSKWWQEYNDIGKATLAKYIVHRRVVLTLLEKALKITESGKFSKEEIIHKVIFPLRATSNDVPYDDHNLWILDEKLVYHNYLASDIALKKNDRVESESASRPDLLFFFDRPIAITQEDFPYSSGIVIFEFKRPMRDDYSADENPIQQVYKYVREIKEGKAKSKDGRLINIPPSTPFYCYVVSDLTPSLREQAENSSLASTPDNSGYIGFNGNVGAYIEIISFDKLLGDARKRNRILFDKLNLLDKEFDLR
jgi:hypothetical protein